MTAPARPPASGSLTDVDLPAARRRVRATLVTGQVLAGLGMGSTLSTGALVAAEVSGSTGWSGMAATMSTVGAAAAAIPLASLASRAGRAPALATGAGIAAVGGLLCLTAAAASWFAVLLVGLACIGVGTAVNLQTRFAATDLSAPSSRGRDLSIVVWATTVGAVSGPNLIGPGGRLGLALGLPELAGPFLFTIAAQLLAALIYVIGLRPDPLRLAAAVSTAARSATTGSSRATGSIGDRGGVRTGILVLALSHATMVSVMAMTPVHLIDHGATLVVVGVTISLHIAGMYALSPIFGILSDRLGRLPTILLGQTLSLASLLATSLGAESSGWVVVGLILLGLGWSASTVAGSALVAESADPATRTRTQGRSDLVMSAAGAIGGAGAGPALALLTYSGLSVVAMALVVAATVAVVLRMRHGTVARTPRSA